jgi:hypothetical protein
MKIEATAVFLFATITVMFMLGALFVATALDGTNEPF